MAAWPASFGARPAFERTKRIAPSSASSAARRRPAVDWSTPSSPAAPLMEPARLIASSTFRSSQFRAMVGSPASRHASLAQTMAWWKRIFASSASGVPKHWKQEFGPKPEDDPLAYLGGDTWFPPGRNEVFGTYEYIIVAHELGHTLGLTDIIEGGDEMAPDRQSTEFAIMTYSTYIGDNSGGWNHDGGHEPQSFMMYDTAALQFMYGADFTTNAGNTLHSFDSATGEMFIDGAGQGTPTQNIIFRTIRDGGGIDTCNFASYGATRDLDIDLAPGGWSDVDRDSHFQAADLNGEPNEGHARGQVFNALQYQGDARSLIENAIGGAGNGTIRGNAAGNSLSGGAGRDSLHGLDGDDTLTQGSGGGLLDGGADNDVLVAGSGADVILGGLGVDRVSYAGSNAGVVVHLGTGTGAFGWAQGDAYSGVEHVTGSGKDDIITGGSGNNALYGEAGGDALNGAQGADVLNGGDGDDMLAGGSGADWLLGGNGTDTARFGGASVTLNLATGVHAGEAAGDVFTSIERFEGSNGDDTMTGDGGTQVFDGRGGDDSLDGAGGNDTLTGGGGFDTLDGGTGTDTADYANAGAAVEVNLAAGIAIGATIDGDALLSIENVNGSAAGDTIRGDAGANRLSGLGGSDSLVGEDGADTLLGGAGNDTLVGGAGDVLTGGIGVDVLRFSGAPVLVNMATGLHGGGAAGAAISGVERIEGTSGGDILAAGAAGLTLAGRDGADSLHGGSRRDTLLGGEGGDSLEGLGGSDILRGGAGADIVLGGGGADIFLWRSGDLGTDVLSDFTLGEDGLAFGAGFLASPVLGGTGALSEMLDAQAFLGGQAVLMACTADAGWQAIARLGGVSVRDLDAAIADGSILAAARVGGFDAIG